MDMLVTILLSAVAVFVSAYIIPGVRLDGFGAALVVAVILGIVNAFLKPILLLITLPINILTLGLFTLVINALMILLVSSLVPGFKVDGFWTALFFGIVLAIVNGFLQAVRG